MPVVILETARLRLEPWAPQHLDGLDVLGRDEQVMRYLGGVSTREQTAASIESQQRRWAAYGFGWWVFLDRATGELIGAGCIQHLGRIETNPLEIGWRLRPDQWGRGLASEAARCMGGWAFDTLDIPLLKAVAVPANTASTRVMERLGMHYTGLEHWYYLDLAAYEITAAEWRARMAAR